MEKPVMFAVCLLGAGLVLAGVVSCEPRRFEIEASQTTSIEGSVPVTTISGTILNTSGKTLSLPNVRLAFRDEHGVDIIVRDTPPSRRSLAPNGCATFSTRVENPPAKAYDFEIYLVGQKPSPLEAFFWRIAQKERAGRPRSRSLCALGGVRLYALSGVQISSHCHKVTRTTASTNTIIICHIYINDLGGWALGTVIL